MSVNSAIERQLSETEADLRTTLQQSLPICAKRGTLLFFNSENLPENYRNHWLPEESDKLLALAKKSLALRTQLEMDVFGTLGQLFLSACDENAKIDNPHRRGPRKLATWLLAEISSLKQSKS